MIGPNLSGAGLTEARTGSSRAQGDMHRLWEGLYQYMPYTEESRCREGKVRAEERDALYVLASRQPHNKRSKQYCSPPPPATAVLVPDTVARAHKHFTRSSSRWFFACILVLSLI